MKILLVYPEIPATFWSFKDALNFISKRSAEPPLGLITVAAFLPEHWEKRLIDMNVAKLKDQDIQWADYVFLSGMSIQIKSFKEVIRRANVLGTKVVAGGPLATTQKHDFLGIDHLILREAEVTLPQFIKDVENGTPKPEYEADEYPDITNIPVPRWDLLQRKRYASMSVQYSRGCPYDCEFCSITMLNGRKPRTKTKEQFLHELDVLYNLGWRGGVSVVDDNFIGNKRVLKTTLLPALVEWSKQHKYPFTFVTEVSINLADDDELASMMIDAGFNSIFVGIESPNDSSLEECGKAQNLKRNLIESVERLQNHGFMVSAGFIIGFDNDPKDIFEKQISFIQESGICSAMIGLLNAPIGTKLFRRLKEEKRLLENFSGDNVDGSINFIPKMKYTDLLAGYARVINTIYSPKEYYKRVSQFLKNYNLPKWASSAIDFTQFKAFIKLLWKIGIKESGRKYFWRLLITSLFRCPKKFSLAMTMVVYGHHFRKVAATI